MKLILSENDKKLLTNYKIRLDKNSGYYRIYFDDGSYKYLHRYLLDAKAGEIVDHKDRNKYNNSRENLRIVTKKLNNYNKEIKNKNGRGIYYDYCGKRYRACISHNNKTLKLGSFKNINDAKVAYNKKSRELYGVDAYQHLDIQ